MDGVLTILILAVAAEIIIVITLILERKGVI